MGRSVFHCDQHGFTAGERILISGTRYYDGGYRVLPSSAEDMIHIRADYKPERIKAASCVMHELNAPLFAKLTCFRFHDLRHTYASLLIHQKENIKYIQTQLGHSSPMVTLNVYAHLMEPRNQDAACRLESIVFAEGIKNKD